jgi:carbamoyltransferase
MRILGLSCYFHDSAASLVKDGQVIAAAEEERFSRQKHDHSFPKQAINYCLQEANLNLAEVDLVAFYEKPILKFDRFITTCTHSFPWSLPIFCKYMAGWTQQKLRLSRELKHLGYTGDIAYFPHHLSHAAAAYFTSPFTEAAVLTIDGAGEWATTAIGSANGNYLKLSKQIDFPNSIGLLYSAITAFLGFEVNEGEYKVMGLSAYGEQNKATNPYFNKLSTCVNQQADGSFALDMNFFPFPFSEKMFNQKLTNKLGLEPRKPSQAINHQHEDLAAALQLLAEDLILNLCHAAYKQTPSENLVLAGGVALNCVANKRIAHESPFKHIWIPPNPSDGGSSLGAALLAAHTIGKSQRQVSRASSYLGPGYTISDIKQTLAEANLSYTELPAESLASTIAQLLAQDQVVGLFQGPMEFGPRALGNRSILASPAKRQMIDRLNLIKKREPFRPFAPAACANNLAFVQGDGQVDPARFMLTVFDVQPDWLDKMPAVAHIDGTARLQVVHRPDNPRYFDIIAAFHHLTGLPAIINTSLNVKGDPIACTPADALDTFRKAGLDYLLLENLLIRKNGQ